MPPENMVLNKRRGSNLRFYSINGKAESKVHLWYSGKQFANLFGSNRAKQGITERNLFESFEARFR